MNINLKDNKISIVEIILILLLFILFLYSILNIKIKNTILHTYEIVNYSDNFKLFIVQDIINSNTSNNSNIIILDTKGNFGTIKNKYINNTRCNIQETEKITTLGIFKTVEVNYNSICEF